MDHDQLFNWIYEQHCFGRIVQKIPDELQSPGWQTARQYFYHDTPLMHFIRYCKESPIFKELLYPNYQTDRNANGETPIMLWIKYRPNEEVPTELFYKYWNEDCDNAAILPLDMWIFYRRTEDLPDEKFFYSGWMSNKRQFISTWIQRHIYQPDEPRKIPHKLTYPAWQNDKHITGETPLMEWIDRQEYEPIPKELFYPKYQTDTNPNGDTPLMIWIRERYDEPIPPELFYNGWQKSLNDDGETPETLWQSFHPNEDLSQLISYPQKEFSQK